MKWLICPEDDFMTEVDPDDSDSALSTIADHILDAHTRGNEIEMDRMMGGVIEL